MRAMLLRRPRAPLELADVADPEPGPGQVAIRVAACAVCRTDLHILDGELADAKLPLVPGHQIVGTVERVGAGVDPALFGVRVGVPWLGWTCGSCAYCTSGRENLCDAARFTGYHLDGGYAERCLADARYCFRLPAARDDADLAPLLCAGLIGHRALRMCGECEHLALYGFGAAAHLVIQTARFLGKRVGAFVRPGDDAAKRFAARLGASWACASDEPPPEAFDAAIVFAPDGRLVVHALEHVKKGGTVVCGGIHMSDIPSFPYRLLWGERSLRSVANLTRQDGEELLQLAPKVPLTTEVTRYPLEQANEALDDLRHGRLDGAAVLVTGAA
jgi:propanol-preferring alcohol dehydrogenase